MSDDITSIDAMMALLPPHDLSKDSGMFALMLEESVGLLQHLLGAIKKWEGIAWNEFASFECQLKDKYPNGFPEDYDPLTDEAFIRHHTGMALYGSLAVAIAAKVENDLAWLCRVWGVKDILKKGSPSKATGKPYFEDYIHTLEVLCECRREDLLHYQDHLFVRELGNRFKHSGGRSTKDFVEQFGTVAGMSEVEQDIPYDRFCWECHITQATEFLLDVSKRLFKSLNKGEDCEQK